MTLPVDRKLSGGRRQDRGSKILDLNPRESQKAAVVDDVLQIAGASFRVPTDPLIIPAVIFQAGLVHCRAARMRLSRDSTK